MSLVYQYENTTIQFGDESGNISHQGILASNVSGTPLLNPTFPTTSTGASLGHYHYTEPGTNALKFLNVAGTGLGGHKFYTSNSTTVPVNTATIGLDGFTIDRSTTGNPQTINMLDNLTITSGTKSCLLSSTLLRNNTIKTTLNMDNNTLNFVDALGTTQTTMTSDSYQINNEPEGVSLGFGNNRFYITQVNTNVGTIIYSGQIQQTDLPNNNQTVLTTSYLDVNLLNTNQKSRLTSNSLTINDLSTNVSILTPTDLTFNNINVKMNQFTPTLIYSSPVIYADGQPPATSLLIRNTYGYSGWYFKNITSLLKINWYFPPNKLNNTLVSDLKGVSISFFNGATTSNDNTLFITIYTVPTGSGDYAPGFFHSSNTYVFNQSITPTVNTNYQGVCIINKSLVPFNYETQIQYEQSSVNNPRGSYQPTDKILAVVIGSNSASATNSVEFVVNKLNLHYADFTQSYLLVSP